MMDRPKVSRRTFIKGTSALAGASAFPLFNILPGGVSPNEKIGIASIGMGKRASQLTASIFAHSELDPQLERVAFCDPYENAGMHSWGPPYAEKVRKEYADVPWFKDYRVMFDRMGDDIDAVIVCGVTNFLYPAMMHSMQRGKHVSVTKPMCVTVEEARNLVKAVEKYGIVTEWHANYASLATYRDVLASDVLGEVREVHLNPLAGGPYRMSEYPDGRPEAPDFVEWNIWSGVQPRRTYNPVLLMHGGWNAVYGLGCGSPTHWQATHALNPHLRALELGLPTSVTLVHSEPVDKGHNMTVEYRFPRTENRGPISLRMYVGGGYDGAKDCDYPNAHIPAPKGIDPERLERMRSGKYGMDTVIVGSKETAVFSSSPRIVPENRMKEMLASGAIEQVHSNPTRMHGSWLDAIKTGDLHCNNNLIDSAAPVMEVLLLGNVAMELGRVGHELKYDAEKIRFTNDDEANSVVHMRRRYRNEFVTWDLKEFAGELLA